LSGSNLIVAGIETLLHNFPKWESDFPEIDNLLKAALANPSALCWTTSRTSDLARRRRGEYGIRAHGSQEYDRLW
jgi:hypothetical protein